MSSISPYLLADGKTKRYRVRYRTADHRQTERRGFRTKKAAQAFAAQLVVGPPATDTPANAAHVYHPYLVYRLYDIHDVLLYVGSTNDIRVRLKQHAADERKPWCPGDVCYAKIRIVYYRTHSEASDAEETAIADEDPLYNERGAGRRLGFISYNPPETRAAETTFVAPDPLPEVTSIAAAKRDANPLPPNPPKPLGLGGIEAARARGAKARDRAAARALPTTSAAVVANQATAATSP